MTGAGSRRKGRTFQTAVRQWWEEQIGKGYVIEPGGAGAATTDLVLITPHPQHNVSVEVKNRAALDLATWVDQAVAQAPAETVACVMHKRRGRGDVGESYVTLRAEDFRRLL